jgi:hypothetical protein
LQQPAACPGIPARTVTVPNMRDADVAYVAGLSRSAIKGRHIQRQQPGATDRLGRPCDVALRQKKGDPWRH